MGKKIALIVLCGLVMLGIRGAWAQQQARTEEKKTESRYQEPDRGFDNQVLQEKTVPEQTETQERQVNASSDMPMNDDKTQGGSVTEAGEAFVAALLKDDTVNFDRVVWLIEVLRHEAVNSSFYRELVGVLKVWKKAFDADVRENAKKLSEQIENLWP